MDPDANVAEQRRLKAKIKMDAHDRARLRDLRAALREWLAGGCFPPKSVGGTRVQTR
jgi:hypothetical protein